MCSCRACLKTPECLPGVPSWAATATGLEKSSTIISKRVGVGMSGLGLVPRNCWQQEILGAAYAVSLRRQTKPKLSMLIFGNMSRFGSRFGSSQHGPYVDRYQGPP